MAAPDLPTLIRMAEVCRQTGMAKSSVYAAIEHSGFPKPVKLGKRTVAWEQARVTEWITSRPTRSA